MVHIFEGKKKMTPRKIKVFHHYSLSLSFQFILCDMCKMSIVFIRIVEGIFEANE